MPRYQDLLEEEVKRLYKDRHDSFHLQGDKAKLTPSYGSLYHALDENADDDMDEAWDEAVKNYKRMNEDDHEDDSQLSYGENSPSMAHSSRAQQKLHWKRYQTRNIILRLSIVCVALYTILIVMGPWILVTTMHKSEWCPIHDGNATESSIQYENPDYDQDECYFIRLPLLFYLTMEEADLCTRMLISVLLGGAIGYERRSADRPAGVRTMGLVSLGSCFFTISSQLAFKSSTMGWDASRVTAAIPSGCGFLGAGLIWKGQVREGEHEKHEIHGLTTAAGVWLSAAIGAGCGGKMYFVSAYSMVLVTVILRYGPKIYLCFDHHDDFHQDYQPEKSHHGARKFLIGEDRRREIGPLTTKCRTKEHSLKDVHIKAKKSEEAKHGKSELRSRYRAQNVVTSCSEGSNSDQNDISDDDLSCSESSMELAHVSLQR